jgi:tetratricopeptide (TPR) repeat protein
MRALKGGVILAAVAAAAAALGADAAAAQAPGTESMTTFGGNALADQCADAAVHGLTGVRIEQICAQAADNATLLPIDRAGTIVNLGVIRLRSGRFEEADDDFSAAIRLMPDLAEAYVNRGAARIGMRKFKESVADLNKALSLGVKEPEKAYYDRGLAYEWLDNPKAAYADYKKALELSPAWELAQQQIYRFKVTHAELIEPEAPAPAATASKPPG